MTLAIPWRKYWRLPRRLPLEDRHSRYSLIFNGVADIVSVPHSASLNLTTSITLAAWIRLSANPVAAPRIFIKDTGIGAATYGLFTDGSRKFYFYMNGAQRVISIGAVPLLTWARIVATWDSVSQLPRVYINGVLDNTGAVWAGPIATNALPLLIGNVDTLNRGFSGIIDEPLVSNLAWTAQEAWEDSRRGYAQVEPGCVMALRMEEGTGLTAYDSSPSGNNGTIAGPTWRRNQLYELLAEAGV